MDVDDTPQNEDKQDDDRLDVAASFKSFHLLNALSDLLMLPKDMLLEKSIRKEVCLCIIISWLCTFTSPGHWLFLFSDLITYISFFFVFYLRFVQHSVHQ